jgi:hypothetical protein
MMNRHMNRKRGVLLIDVAMAAGVLGILLTVTVHLVGRLAAERRALDRRQFAVTAANNLLERMTARPHEEVTESVLGSQPLDATVARMLVDARLSVRVKEEQERGPEGKWITVELRWPGRGGVDERPVRLTTWKARVGGGER